MTLKPSRPVFLLLFLACAVALTSVLVGEQVFGLRPCILCLYERIPYAVAGLIALIMIGLPTSPRLRWLGLGLITLAFLVSCGLSFYHIGVEQHWWDNPACTGGPMDAMSLDDLKAAISKPVRPACEDIQWSLFGITLAGYNLIYSVVLSAFCLLVAQRGRRAA